MLSRHTAGACSCAMIDDAMSVCLFIISMFAYLPVHGRATSDSDGAGRDIHSTHGIFIFPKRNIAI